VDSQEANVGIGNRDRLILAMRNRIGSARPENARPLFDAEGSALRRSLLSELVRPDASFDYEILYLLAAFHWSRYLALPAGEDQAELMIATDFFTPIYQSDFSAVPPHISSMLHGSVYDTGGRGENASAAADIAGRLIDEVRQEDDVVLLDQAIAVLRRSIAQTPAPHPNRAGMLSNLGIALRKRYERSGAKADVAEAVDVLREAAVLASGEGRGPVLTSLGLALRARYEADNSLETLTEAIGSLREALALSPRGQPLWANRSANLGAALRMLFERTGELAALDEAIERLQEAAAAAPAADPELFGTRADLGIALLRRSERVDQPEALDGAIIALREALASGESRHPAWPDIVSALGVALGERYEQFGDKDALTEAIALARKAVALTPRDQRDYAARLSNLGGELRSLFDGSGDLAALDEAIDLQRQSVAANDGPSKEMSRTNLGLTLITRYKAIGDWSARDEAIEHLRRAVADSPGEQPSRLERMSFLGSVLGARYRDTGDQSALKESLTLLREAAGGTPRDHPDWPGLMMNLSATLKYRYERDGDLAALSEAVSTARAAATAISPDRADRSAWLSNLGTLLDMLADSTGDQETRAEAVARLREALAIRVLDEPERAQTLLALGTALIDGQSQDPAAREEALAAFREAARSVTAVTTTRIAAAVRWGALAGSSADPTDALSGYAEAVALLPRLAGRQLHRADQERLLGIVPGLASDAAACAIATGDPSHAVELLELGRGILLGQVLELRTDIAELARQHPDLAARVQALRGLLDSGPAGAGSEPHGLAPKMLPDGLSQDQPLVTARPIPDQRHALIREWDEVLTAIRRLPGFAQFLAAPSMAAIEKAAGTGSIVFVNVSRYRSDALILRSAGNEVVRLAELTPDAVNDRVSSFLAALATAGDGNQPIGARLTASATITDTLGWLWDTVTAPVLERIGLDRCPADGEWPRLWWIPTGALAFLPLHAAGHHPAEGPHPLRLGDPAPPTVMDWVISSYTPTVRALMHLQSRSPDSVTQPHPLVVAVPETPQAPSLPGAAAEAHFVADRFPSALLLEGARATRQQVLDALPVHNWAHFACHAQSDPIEPSTNGLILHDGPLTVTEIASRRADNADVAFLSACSTARGGSTLADEAIHIAGAFQLAGYANVVATLWPIPDDLAVEAARSIYEQMNADSAAWPVLSVAAAVHSSVRHLRRAYPAAPAIWAAHIHYGV
jgi:tetratricopeptide (TPR) repeat protein